MKGIPLKDCFVKTHFQVRTFLAPGDNLGLVIRGGVEYQVGIFVIHVDAGSVAENLGLEVKTFR